MSQDQERDLLRVRMRAAELEQRQRVAARERSIDAVMSISPISGQLRTVLGVLPSSAATMCLVTAFFEPFTLTSPLSGPTGSIRQELLGGVTGKG